VDQTKSLPKELYQQEPNETIPGVKNENIVNQLDNEKFGEFLDNFLLLDQSERKLTNTHSKEDMRFQTP